MPRRKRACTSGSTFAESAPCGPACRTSARISRSYRSSTASSSTRGIYYFLNGGEEELYLASADWMTRNLDKRVELMFPIEHPQHRARVMYACGRCSATTSNLAGLMPMASIAGANEQRMNLNFVFSSICRKRRGGSPRWPASALV